MLAPWAIISCAARYDCTGLQRKKCAPDVQEVERRDCMEVHLLNESRLPDKWLALSSMNAADEGSSLLRCLDPQPLDKQVSAAK